MNTLITSNTIDAHKAAHARHDGPESWKDSTQPPSYGFQLEPSRLITARGKGVSTDGIAGHNTGGCTYETEETDEIKEAQDTNEIKEAHDGDETEETEQIGRATGNSIDTLSPNPLDKIDAAMCDHRVLSYGDFNRSLFMLAQTVRSIEEELKCRLSIPLTAEIAKKWQTSNRDNLDKDHDYVAEFFAKLDLVRFPQGGLARAVEVARSVPPPKQTLPLGAECQLLAKLCRVLQYLSGNKPFFLDGRSAAKVLDIPHRTVADWLHALRRLGVISPVTKGRLGKASRYRYIASEK
jgi:hypothetical protein